MESFSTKKYDEIQDNIADIQKQLYMYSLMDEEIVSSQTIKKLNELVERNLKAQARYDTTKFEKNDNIIKDLFEFVNETTIDKIIHKQQASETPSETPSKTSPETPSETSPEPQETSQEISNDLEDYIKRLFLTIIGIDDLKKNRRIKRIKQIPETFIRGQRQKNGNNIKTLVMKFEQFCETCNILLKDNQTNLSKYFNENELAKQFYEFDDDCSGTIDYNEFYKWVTGQPPKSSSSTDNTKLPMEFTREEFNKSIELLNPHKEFVCLEKILKEEKNSSDQGQKLPFAQKIKSFEIKIQNLITANENELLKEIYLHRYQILKNRWNFEINQVKKNYTKIYFLYCEFIKINSVNGDETCATPDDKVAIEEKNFATISDMIFDKYGNKKYVNKIFNVQKVQENFKTPYYMQYIVF